MLGILASAVLALFADGALADQPVEYAKPVASRLNASGQLVRMPVPLLTGEEQIGDVTVSIDAADQVAVSKSQLLDALGPALDASAVDRLTALPDRDGELSLADLAGAGFDITFDPGQLALIYVPSGSDRAAGDLSLGGAPSGRMASAAAVEPAKLAGYVNLGVGIEELWGEAEESGTELTFAVEPTLRALDVALSGAWLYGSSADTFVCPVGAYCTGDRTDGLKRRFTRAVYDRPADLLRLEVGDTEPYATQLQRPTDTLGIAIAHTPRTLEPGRSLAPTGSASFRLEHPADVDVIVNGNVVRHLRLAAGPYNLHDIPLAPGANTVTLEITDELGQRRTETFTTVFDNSLLAPGVSEWAISGGVPSYLHDDERVYRESYLTGQAFLRYGIGESLTAEVQAQADNDVAEGGGRLFAALPLGFVSLGAAASTGRLGEGYATDASWSLTNTRLLLRDTADGRESLTARIEYRSSGFRTPGEHLDDLADVIYPELESTLNLYAHYSAALGEGITATLAGRYALDRDVEPRSVYDLSGDRYGLDVGLSAPVGDWMTAALNVGYGNDAYSAGARDEAEWYVGLRFQVTPDEHTIVTASTSTLERASSLSADRHAESGGERWDASVDADHDSDDGSTVAGGSLGYLGNRLEARLGHVTGFRSGEGASATQTMRHRTSLDLGTAIAFADGHVAIGAPVRGDAFAIVYPHESLAGKEIAVGDPDAPRAVSGGLGPALVGDLPAYAPTSLPVDVPDLPLGYSLGQGGFDLTAPYRGGYALEVGSSHSVTAFGTLLDAYGDPVALVAGTASEEGGSGRKVEIFTNGAGRFGADGLAPGRWRIEMPTQFDTLGYVIDIPEGTEGLYKAGTLLPTGGAE